MHTPSLSQFKRKEVDIDALTSQVITLELEDNPSNPHFKNIKNVIKKPPKEKKIRPVIKEFKHDTSKVFGIPLTDIIMDDNTNMPLIWIQLLSVLEEYASKTKDIFSKKVPISDIDEFINKYESGNDIDWENEDKHIIGGVLIAFLLRLPEPILPFDIYDKCINIAMSNVPDEAKFIQWKTIIFDIPTLNKIILEDLINFLDTLTYDSNNIKANNLAVCFTPALLRPQVESDIDDSEFATNIITAIIEQYAFFFKDEEISCIQEENIQESIKLDVFVQITRDTLGIIMKKLLQIENNLDSPKFWNKSSILHLNACHQLILKCIQGDVNTINEDVIKKEEESLSLVVNVEQGCKNLKSKIKDIFLVFADKQVILREQQDSQALVLVLCVLCKNTKKLLDWVDPLLQSEPNGCEIDRSLVDLLVPEAQKQVELVKRHLDVCTKYHEAVIISRVIRGTQKAITDKTKSPLTQIDFKVPDPKTQDVVSKKIEMVQDTLEYSFPLIKKLLHRMQQQVNDPNLPNNDAMLYIELLKEITTVFNAFLAGSKTVLPTTPVKQRIQPRKSPTTQPSRKSPLIQEKPLVTRARSNTRENYPKESKATGFIKARPQHETDSRFAIAKALSLEEHCRSSTT